MDEVIDISPTVSDNIKSKQFPYLNTSVPYFAGSLFLYSAVFYFLLDFKIVNALILSLLFFACFANTEKKKIEDANFKEELAAQFKRKKVPHTYTFWTILIARWIILSIPVSRAMFLYGYESDYALIAAGGLLIAWYPEYR